MNSLLKYSGVVALVILAIIGFYKFSEGSSNTFGATACSNITCISGGLRLVTDAGGDFEADVASVFSGAVSLTSTFKLGTNGSSLSMAVATTCNLIINDTTVAASTSKAYDCAVSGVQAGDKVFADFATTTPNGTGSGGVVINGVSASSTSGFVTFKIINMTGATLTTAGSNLGSSTQVMVLR